MSRQPRTTPRKSHRFELDLDVELEKELHEKLVELGRRGKASIWIIESCLSRILDEDAARVRALLDERPVSITPHDLANVPTMKEWQRSLTQDDDAPTYEDVENA